MEKYPEVSFVSQRLSPEKNLIAAIIIRTIADVCGGGLDNKQNRAAGVHWLYCGSDKQFSFLWCCDVLEIEPKAVMAFVKRCQKEGFENLMPDWCGDRSSLRHGEIVH